MIYQKDVQSFHYAKERNKLFLVEVNYLKDQLAQRMTLKWREGEGPQPSGFMNFPTPSNFKYSWTNFFEHYESEKWVAEHKENGIIAYRWEKKTSVSQNHMWDCAVYNMVVRDIFVAQVMDMLKLKNYSWPDFVNVVMGTAKAEK